MKQLIQVGSPISGRNKILKRLLCTDPMGRPVTVLECRYFAVFQTERGLREYPGAMQWRHGVTGLPLKLIDSATFQIPETGEILTMDENF